MTMPKSVRGKSIDEVPVGEPLGRSWILLFGVVPVDYDDLYLAELDAGRRFLERSQLFSMSSWQHEREVRPDGAGCEVSDLLTFRLRRPLAALPGSAAAAQTVIARVFRHRHRRLAAWFGSAG